MPKEECERLLGKIQLKQRGKTMSSNCAMWNAIQALIDRFTGQLGLYA
jgi:hypothetical protein